MVFDNRDFGVLMLCGLCRYLPSGLNKIFNSPFFTSGQLITLRNHKLIKMQSNRLSYTLTFQGREVLEKFGYSFPKDARVDIGKTSYLRKLKSAKFSVTLFLAGINVFYDNTQNLSKERMGYVSSLLMRSTRYNKVLAGARFLGVLKIGDSVYIPYHIENSDEWIIPGFESDTFTAQVTAMKSIRDIKLILSGKSLEVLLESIYPIVKSFPESNGLKRFDIALEELGYDYLLVPENDFGVMQLSIIKIAGYRRRLARAFGCNTEDKREFSVCDGVCDNIPYIIAVDFNVKRIVRILNEIEKINPNVIPKVCCLEFQENELFSILDKFNVQETTILSIDESNIKIVFPEIEIDYKELEAAIGKEGIPIDANERKIRKNNIKVSET